MLLPRKEKSNEKTGLGSFLQPPARHFNDAYRPSQLPLNRTSIRGLSSISMIPFDWQEDASHFGKMRPKSKAKLTMWYFWCAILWLRTGTLGVKLLYQIGEHRISIGIGVIFFLWLSVFVAGSLLVVHPIVKMKEFCITLNAFMDYETRHGVQQLTGATNLVAVLLVVQTSCIPFVLPLFCWIAPCAPQFIGSGFLTDDEGNCIASWQHKLGIYVVEVICTFPIGGICAFFSVYAIYLTKSLNRYLLHIRRMATRPRNLVRNLYNLTSMVYSATLYRQTQLLVQLYHECFQRQLLPNMLFSSSVIIICCLFATVELQDEFPLVIYIAFPFVLVLTSMFLLIMLEMASRVMLLSKSIKVQWASRYCGKSPWFKKFTRSCPPLKIVAGPFSKIGRDRIAIVIRFCLQRTIFLITWYRKVRGLRLQSLS